MIPSPPAQRRSRLKLLLIMLVFLAPMLAAATAGSLTVTLHDQQAQRPIWAAKAESESSTPETDAEAMALTAEKIVAALARDRMIRPAVAGDSKPNK